MYATQFNLAELALEVQSAEREAAFRELSYSCELEAMYAGKSRSKLEYAAAKIDLPLDLTRDVLDDWKRRATLLNEAARLLRAMIPFEQQIRPVSYTHLTLPTILRV